ncbi:MAG TPA: LysM peptidoglycan-binding domain-containing protein, partial [Verrucomicrobiae bacterium]|nr:LysM peptidoglycan-binding domain-containing protein [Verrucomicrobiae bacterium]
KRETKDYVPKLLAAAIIAKEPARFGFADVAYLPAIEFDVVPIPSRTDLDVVARICEVPVQTIRELNPELRRWCTPPDYPGYQLKIPKGKKELFLAEYARIPEGERFRERTLYGRYRAKGKETLAAVAKRFATTEEELARLNGLKPGKKIAGRVLTVPVKGEAEEAPAQKPVAIASAKQVVFKKYYTVQKGDTISSLSRKFNVSEKILLAWNSLKGSMSLRPGRKIIVAKYTEKPAG